MKKAWKLIVVFLAAFWALVVYLLRILYD